MKEGTKLAMNTAMLSPPIIFIHLETWLLDLRLLAEDANLGSIFVS